MGNDLPLTKETILETAEQVFRRYGPDKTSVVDVARMLQVSHGTLYRHFPSKAALREAVTERWLQRITIQLKEISERSDGAVTDRLRLWFKTLIQNKRTSATDDPEMFAMYTAVTLEAVEIISSHVEHLILQIARMIEEGIQSSEFQEGRPEDIARALFFATSRFHHPAHSYEWSTTSIDEEFISVWNLILSGLLRLKP